ncbi:MAG: imelysin family protein [Bacteroidota bacterium]
MRFSLRTSSLLLLLLVPLVLVSCDSGGGVDPEPEPPEEPGFDRMAMLANMGNNIVLPAYVNLQASIAALEEATDAFVASPNMGTLGSAQDALKAARMAWQDANLFQFGPAESVTLRAALNTYPVDDDRVEDNVSSGNYALGSISDGAAGGLPTLGYLLHSASMADVVALYSTDADAEGRRAYLQDNVDFIKGNVDTVVQQWQASGGNYIGTFLDEDRAGTDVGSALGMVINALSLHYERFLRDGKIGIPAGVRSAGIPRPNTTEALYGGYSAELARANVEAVERLFLGVGLDGTDGIGLDEQLEALEATDLTNDIKTSLTNIKAATGTVSDPLSADIEADRERAVSVFTTMQQFVVLFKTDMTSVLGVSITYQDVDGD